KACGEGLLPGALAAVRALGVDPPGHPLTGISYRAPGRHADHRFAAAAGRGVRRTTLHHALSERATDVGGARLHGRVTALRQDHSGVTVEVTPAGGTPRTVRASWVLGCDGLGSTVRRLSGLDAAPGPRTGQDHHRYGLRRHF